MIANVLLALTLLLTVGGLCFAGWASLQDSSSDTPVIEVLIALAVFSVPVALGLAVATWIDANFWSWPRMRGDSSPDLAVFLGLSVGLLSIGWFRDYRDR